MAVLPITKHGDPVLTARMEPITEITDELRTLIDDMIDTMRASHGVGLAAPQIGVSLRVAVIEIPDEDVLVLINPEITKKKGERVIEEGCLSVPGYQGELTRAVTVKVRARDRDGREIRVTATDDVLAQALEHEIDHLEGKLYTDLIDTPEQLWRLQEDVQEWPA